MKISAVWIVKNEEYNIVRSINSLKALADELVVVDTGSSDGTVAAAEALGARVERFEWTGDFSEVRNHALALATGDVLILPDADEWFAPALTKANRAEVERLFGGGAVTARVEMSNLYSEDGPLIEKEMLVRLAKGHGAVRYEGRVHERLCLPGGGPAPGGDIKGWNLNHDGYAPEKLPGKAKRNIEMLRRAVERAPEGQNMAAEHAYLMRECSRLGSDGEALENLAWLLAHPAQVRALLRDLEQLGQNTVFAAVKLAARLRRQVSRRQLLDAMVLPAEHAWAAHPAGKTVRLYYQYHLDFNEKTLLEQAGPAIEAAEALRKGAAGMEDYLRGNVDLYTAAARASWRRGEREATFDLAAKALRQAAAVLRYEALRLVMQSTRGLPASDIILFLNSVLDTSRVDILNALVGQLHYEGEKEPYAYYQKKLIDAGGARKSDFWYLMILLGEPAEAAEQVVREGADAEVVARTLFFAVAAGGGQGAAILEKHGEALGRYRELAVYMAGGPAPDDPDFKLAVENYGMLAFAAGRRVANRLLMAFPRELRACALLQGEWYLGGGLYHEYLVECHYRPGDADVEGRLIMAECLVMVDRHNEALQQLMVLVAAAPVNDQVFNLLEVVAEKAEDKNTQNVARQVTAQIRPLYNEMVDWQDVANTGWVPGEPNRKQKKALGMMTPAQFDKSVTERTYPPLKGQLKAAEAAARIYLEKERYTEALECLRRVLEYGSHVKDKTAVTRLLVRLFEAVENAPVARALENRI